jgi:hypothetical protein
MPNLDGTGPSGEGAGTGRGQGPCKTDTDINSRRSLGLGRKFSLGRGDRNFSPRLGRNQDKKSV